MMIATGPSHAPCYHEEAKCYQESTVCHARKEALAKSTEDLEEAIRKDLDNRFITFCLKLGPISWYDYNFDASYLWKDVKLNMPIIDRLWGEVFRDIDITTNLKFSLTVFKFRISIFFCIFSSFNSLPTDSY